MFYEYAVDPVALSNWERVRFFFDAFGPWKGRFLTDFPSRKWRRMIYDGLACGDVEKKRIEERLRSIDTRVFSRRSKSAYSDGQSWIDNAVAEHRQLPFRAIITTEKRPEDFVLDASDLDDRQPLWAVPHGRLIERRAEVVAEALRVLIARSKRVVMVDPYFRADHDDKRLMLVSLCRIGSAEVDVHFAEGESRPGYRACMEHATRALPGSLPEGTSVTLHCWKEKAGGPRLHNRYLLTEIGGVQFGDSIESGSPGQTDRISILEESTRSALWADFAEGGAFERAGEKKTFVGTRRV